MSNVGRLVLTCVAALLIGACTCNIAFDLHDTGVVGTVLHSAVIDWAFFLLPVLTAALVNRWWALWVALVPFAVLLYLHSATDYVYPYHEDPYPSLAVMGTFFLLGISSLGLLLRAVVDRISCERWFSNLRSRLG